MSGFLPICNEDMKRVGWDRPDFVYVIGDAYVDHPSFGHAIISRMLESRGYRVAMISQPDWRDETSVKIYGEPRLGFLVMGGNMDSMVNHYTVAKKRRDTDAYTPGGKIGKRPDYAVTVYCNLIRRSYKDTKIIIGGIEASLRRLAHYDYWSDKVRRSVLMDSGADLLIYGMGERSVVEAAKALENGGDFGAIKGTCRKVHSLDGLSEHIRLPSFEKVRDDKPSFAKSFYTQYKNTDPFTAKRLVEGYPDGWFVVQEIPQPPLSVAEMDEIYGLPYMRDFHPSYREAGGVPAMEEIKFSITANRGCFGCCSFCALTFHQGRIIQTRSDESVLAEARLLTKLPDFKGYIHDVGGPTANFHRTACDKQLKCGACSDRLCLFPSPCPNMKVDHSGYLALLRKLRALPGVKKVFIRSGIRFDYLMADKDDSFMRELVKCHVSGQLKVAPEHVSDGVLSLMGKPKNSVYRKFLSKYDSLNKEYAMSQFVVPYLMSSHPGSGLREAVELAEYLRDTGSSPEQVQDFYPTPSTISTCMYHTGLDPRTGEKVFVVTDPHQKALQRALIRWRDPANRELVREALIKAGRRDLIGSERKCLVPDNRQNQLPQKNKRKPNVKKSNFRR